MAGWSGYSEKGQGSEERGPGTFTFAPPGVPQQQGSAPIMAKMGYQTAQSVGGLTTYNEQGDKTAAALFGFAETMLKPVAQELAARKFLEGVQRAASGEALTEIVNEQPWYSKIFGPSSAVEGARQYSLDAQAAKFDAAVQQAMPSLRNTSPDELPGIIQKMSKEFETGDPATDTQLGLRLTKVLPNLIQQHTREYYKAQQEHAANQRFDAWQQLATSLQATVTAGNMASEDDKLLRQANLLQALQLPEGVDADSWKQSLGTFTASLAEAGQFHALKTVQDSGVLGNLSPEKRLTLERQIRTFKKQAAQDAQESYSEQLVSIRAKATLGEFKSGKEVLDAFRAVNEDYAKRTGNDEPVIPRSTQAGTAMTALQALLAYQREGAKAVKAAESEVESLQRAGALLQTGTYNQAVTAAKAEGVKESVVAEAARMQFLAQPDVKSQAAWLIKSGIDGGYVSSIKDDIQARLGMAQDAKDANFVQSYQLYRELIEQHPTQGGANKALLAYFGAQDIKRLQVFHDALGGQSLADAGDRAFALSQQAIVNPSYTFKKDELKDVRGQIDTRIRGNDFMPKNAVSLAGNEAGYFDAPKPMTGASMQIIEASLANHWDVAKSVNKADPFAAAFAAAEQSGLEVYGRYAWHNGRGRESLERKLTYPQSGLPLTKPMIATGLNIVVEQKMQAMYGGDADDVLVLRGADGPDGQPTFILNTMKDGVWAPATQFSGNDIIMAAQSELAKPARERLSKMARTEAIRQDAITKRRALFDQLPSLRE